MLSVVQGHLDHLDLDITFLLIQGNSGQRGAHLAPSESGICRGVFTGFQYQSS